MVWPPGQRSMAAREQNDGARLAALQRQLEDDPRSIAFVSLAEEYLRLERFSEAVKIAERGLLNHPDSVDGRLVLARAEAEQDHIRSALEQIKRALVIDQENFFVGFSESC